MAPGMALAPELAMATATAVATATGTGSRHNARVPRPKITKVGPLGIALTMYDIWRRLPPSQRRWVASQARKHGPRLAQQAIKASKNRRRP